MQTMMALICIMGLIGIIWIPNRGLNDMFGHVRKQSAIVGFC